jgi:hypothetical protein
MKLTFVALASAVVLGGCQGKRQPAPDTVPPTGSVLLKSTPSGAAVFEQRFKRLGKTPLKLERPGGTGLNLQLVKDGFVKKQVFVVVEGGRHKELHRALERLSGTLWVRAGPLRGGHIFIDGQQRSKVPDKLAVTAGEPHKVRVAINGYHPYEEQVTVEAGQTLVVNAILVPADQKRPEMGWLSVATDAPALLFLDGHRTGSAPIERLPLPDGRYQVRLVNEALGRSVERRVTIRKNQVTRLQVRLRKGRTAPGTSQE